MAVTSLTEACVSQAMKAEKRAVSRMPAIPNTRSFGQPDTFFATNPELALELARQLAGRLHRLLAYLADMRAQYADSDGHLTMVDSVLGDLSGSFPDRLNAGQSSTRHFVHVTNGNDPNPLRNTVTASAVDSFSGQALSASASCTVLIRGLPRTGFSATWLLRLAAMLVIAGLTLRFALRRGA